MKAEENTLKLMGFSLLDLAMWKALVTMIIVFSMMWWALCMENKTKQLVTRWLSSVGKESACNAGDPSLIPGMGRSPGEGIGHPLQYSWASLVAQTVKDPWVRKTPGEGHGNPPQYSCLEDPMDRGAWWATVHGVAKSWMWLSDWAQTLNASEIKNIHI